MGRVDNNLSWCYILNSKHSLFLTSLNFWNAFLDNSLSDIIWLSTHEHGEKITTWKDFLALAPTEKAQFMFRCGMTTWNITWSLTGIWNDFWHYIDWTWWMVHFRIILTGLDIYLTKHFNIMLLLQVIRLYNRRW